MKTLHLIVLVLTFLPIIIHTRYLMALENQSTVEALAMEDPSVEAEMVDDVKLKDDTASTYTSVTPVIYRPFGELQSQGMCRCGVFNTTEPTKDDKPVITEELFKLSCDEEGKGKCDKLCTTLARTAVENYGIDILCSSIIHYHNLMPSVHSQLCDEEKWTYTGLTAPSGICCHLFQLIDCEEMDEYAVVTEAGN